MRTVWASFCLAAAVAAQSADPALDKIIQRIKENQARLPNYTCGQNIERRRRGELGGASEELDRLRVDVAVIGRRESFAWPGADAFSEQELFEMAGGRGLTMVGDYASLVGSVFLSGGAVFQREPDSTAAGRPALRFSFRIRSFTAGIRVRVANREVTLKHQGAFLVDAETLQLLRLEDEVLDLPADMDLKSARTTIEYQRVRIGDAEFTLPARTEVETVTRHGGVHRNRTLYTGCRLYAASSTVRFDASEEEAAKTAAGPGAAAVPADLIVSSALVDPLDFARSAAGDELTFIVLTEARREGFRIPKGALLRGRITEFTSRLAPARGVSLRCRLTSVEIGGRQIPLRAQLLDARRLGDRKVWLRVLGFTQDTGENMLLVDPSSSSRIPKGTQFTWSTASREKP